MYMIVWGKSWVFLGIPRHPPSSAHAAGRCAGRRPPLHSRSRARKSRATARAAVHCCVLVLGTGVALLGPHFGPNTEGAIGLLLSHD